MRYASRKSLKDFALVVLFALCVYAFVVLTDAHERFARWAERHEAWQVDEVLLLLALLTVAVAAFAWRRWGEANAEIARRERLQRELEHRATHDALTDLPNRVLLMDRLEHAIEGAIREGAVIAVLFVDLDGFKAVNDSFGHAGGDRLLAQVAERLRRCVRSADTVSRIGGDEFVVLLESVESAEQVVEVAGRILESLRDPFGLEGGEASVSASIGGALDGISEREAEDFVREADHAMYQAKVDGGDRYEISSGR
jgi:diguanylate cyclase (GGDEF)-like protein